MRHVWIGLLTLVLLLVCPSNSLADGIATSSATLDWSGLNFTVSSGLTISLIQVAGPVISSSGASTTLGELSAQTSYSPSPEDCCNTSAFSQYSTSGANVVTQAATVNGFLTSSSQAFTTSVGSGINFAQSSASIEYNFWLYGSGVGTITVNLPYTLSVACNISHPQGVPPGDEVTGADAFVLLVIGPGVIPPTPYESETASCQNNPGITNGVFTLSESFSNPTFGPLVSIDAFASTDATAYVPEPSSLLSLCIGLTALAGTLLRKRFV